MQYVPAEKTYGDDFRLIGSLDVSAQYDDNVFFTETDVEGDFRAVISPKFELVERTERLDARLDARVAQNIWAENEELNALDQFYRGKFGYKPTPRMRISADAGYTRDSQLDRDITVSGLLQGAQVRKRKHFGVSGGYALSEITTTDVSYDYEDVDFEARKRVDYDLHSVNVGLNRNLSGLIPLTTGRTNFSFSRYNSFNTTLDSYSWTFGGTYKFHETLSAHLDIGARYTRSAFQVSRLELLTPTTFRIVTEEAESRQWGGVIQFAFTYTDELTTASVTASHDLKPATGRLGAAQRTSFGFNVSRRFAYEFWGSLSADYFRNKTDRGEFSVQELDEETFRILPHLRYNFTKDLSLEAGYSYVRVVNHVADFEPDRNLIYLQLSFQYPFIE